MLAPAEPRPPSSRPARTPPLPRAGATRLTPRASTCRLLFLPFSHTFENRVPSGYGSTSLKEVSRSHSEYLEQQGTSRTFRSIPRGPAHRPSPASFLGGKAEATVFFPGALASEQRLQIRAAATLSSEATKEAAALGLRRCLWDAASAPASTSSSHHSHAEGSGSISSPFPTDAHMFIPGV